VSFLQSHYESALLDKAKFESIGPASIAKGAKAVSGVLKSVGVGPLSFLRPTAKALDSFSEQQRRVGKILGVFVPFTAEFDYRFSCANTRAAFARLSERERRLINWTPEAINWRDWFMDVHIPALERHVFPEIDKRLERPIKAPRSHETLVALLDEMADRYELAVALQRTEKDGLSRISFRQWRDLSMACASRLKQAGVQRGDRVLLAGSNHPAWPVAFFGILFAGATVVPLESGVEVAVAENLAKASRARLFIADKEVTLRLRSKLEGLVQFGELTDVLRGEGDKSEPDWTTPEDIAALIYTSGTTGNPKGVMLSHGNLTALIASVAPLFPLHKGDRLLSVLPLHHTFELTAGMLVPLSRGSRVVYLDELNAERLEQTLKAGRITAMIGVPALWEMLERRITSKVAEHGALASHVFDYAVELNKSLGKNFGVDAGRLLFGPVHEGLGGHLRFMVSGGAALPASTQQLFAGVGMHLTEGYGLTEASPVLTVGLGKPGSPPGQVGKPIPGVEIRIDQPNAEGVGEVLARGPNVMVGYADDPESTRQTIDTDGWLHTGDLGKFDKKNRLVLVGRAKDVVVTNAGENIYPDDLEARIGTLDEVEEYSMLGVPDGRGGERVACVAVPASDEELSRQQRHERAKRALEKAYTALPLVARPSVTTIQDAKLPRTTTRKVKRKELARMLERLEVAGTQQRTDSQTDDVESTVRAAVAAITRRQPSQLSSEMTLRGDLAFDSLMALELLVALETKLGRSLDAEKLIDSNTLGEVEAFVRASGKARRSVSQAIESEAGVELSIPPQLREAAMQWMGVAQHSFYDRVLKAVVTGRAFIPYNKNTLVAANHQSHLDMGLVKYALGSYGKDLVSLAAQDYFFEGNRWRKAYFENFTNLVPMARGNSLRQALRQAGSLLDGQILEFKSAVGHLALHQKVDILPVWVGGTHAALPKGASLPRRRDVSARIGPPLRYSELKRLTQGMRTADASRAVAKLTERAVRALSSGKVLNTEEMSPEEMRLVSEIPPETLEPVFEELKERFVAGSVKQAVSYYFALGDSERWTVRITPELCEVYPGKVINPADCVLKTSPAIFTRIVREAYTPSPQEFISGMVKSNNVGLLLTFQKAFQLQSGSN
jgi:long-chain acyl-CoA synthetase